jgi:putative FmdB family regulatory protein
MPIYEFRCQRCDERFEERRSMRDADGSASCSQGHPGAVRLLPVFAMTGTATRVSSGCGAGGGCCGGACGAA